MKVFLADPRPHVYELAASRRGENAVWAAAAAA
jgi:hypothetical protein